MDSGLGDFLDSNRMHAHRDVEKATSLVVTAMLCAYPLRAERSVNRVWNILAPTEAQPRREGAALRQAPGG